MKVLVTGGVGFIGSYIVDLLIERGYDVRILDNLEKQVHGGKKPSYLNKNAEFIKGDVKRLKYWGKSLKNVNFLIHLASKVGVGQSMYEPVNYLENNVIGTANFYELMNNYKEKIKKVVIASSMILYGEGLYSCKEHGIKSPAPREIEQLKRKEWELKCPECKKEMIPIPTPENKTPQNLSLYALTKYNQERMAMIYLKSLGISTIVLRPFNVYGPRQSLSNPYTGVTAIFSSRIKNNKPPKIYEDGKQTRDFIFVEDVARSFVKAMESDKNEIYNIGSGEPTTIKKISELLIKLFNKNMKPEITDNFRPMDLRHCYADISKIKKDLNFEPKIGLNKGLKILSDWGEKQKAEDKFEESEKELKNFIRKSE